MNPMASNLYFILVNQSKKAQEISLRDGLPSPEVSFQINPSSIDNAFCDGSLASDLIINDHIIKNNCFLLRHFSHFSSNKVSLTPEGSN